MSDRHWLIIRNGKVVNAIVSSREFFDHPAVRAFDGATVWETFDVPGAPGIGWGWSGARVPADGERPIVIDGPDAGWFEALAAFTTPPPEDPLADDAFVYELAGPVAEALAEALAEILAAP